MILTLMRSTCGIHTYLCPMLCILFVSTLTFLNSRHFSFPIVAWNFFIYYDQQDMFSTLVTDSSVTYLHYVDLQILPGPAIGVQGE